MTEQERADLSVRILEVIQNLQNGARSWVNFAELSMPLGEAGVNYKEYKFLKLRSFLSEFQDVLEFKKEYPVAGSPPVFYVRPKCSNGEPRSEASEPAPLVNSVSTVNKNMKKPLKDSWLFHWASIPHAKIKELSERALPERWYYGETLTQEQENLPILRSYLAYTFKRLCVEEKILFGTDQERNMKYAAFNTGLVDKKYEYIYALLTPNRFDTQDWFLLDFVVAGEDMGKTLIKVFNPLPERADYFENKIQNMLYDTTSGVLSCDYIHIITERTARLPARFLEENCPELLHIHGVSLKDVCHRSTKDKERENYYMSLGKNIKDSPKLLNRLKNRIQDAVNLAIKRVEWNYKTAIPMYFPTRNTVSFLLPLALVDDDCVDLALVVERQASGAYQGQTILPLHLAYSNSRLVARPESDWLKTDFINAEDSDNVEE